MKRYILRTLAVVCTVLIIPGGLWAACVNVPQGLVSWWAAEGNGDDVMGRNPAVVGSGVSFIPGAVGQAFNFGGTGAVVVAASASLNVGVSNGFSIECWIRPNDLNTRQPLLEWRDGSNNGVLVSASDSLCGDNAAGSLFANIVDGNGISHPLYSGVGLLTTSNFQHVAVTYDKGSGIGTLYINGTVAAKAHLGSFTPQTSYPLYIGQSVVGGNLATYSGLMDEVSVYDRELSLREIRAIYSAGASGKCRPTAPFIITQPASQATVVGGNASFSVVARGTQPLSYQWRLEGNALSGATGSALNLSNVQLADAGNYSVVVANVAGSVTSSNATLTVSTGGCVSASSGLVSWWPGEGNGNDIVGSNPGTVSSGVSYGIGEVGQAFNFNGSDGNIVIPASASLNVGTNSGFTIEGWIKPSDVSGMHMLFEWNNGSSWGVHLTHSEDWFGNSGPGDLMANIVDTGGGWHPLFSPPGLLTTNSFQHIAMTYDKASGVGRLYLNGAVIASGNLGSFTPQTSYALNVGKRVSDPNFPLYGGLLDEVSLYGRALTQGEVQSIYQVGSFGKCQSPVAPFIVSQPADQNVVVGATASFSVSAGGSLPLNYQWRYNNTDVSGATNSTLNINNAQLSDGGNYAVVVANPFGFVTSAVAVLTVHEAVCTNAPGGLVSWWAGEGNGSDVAGNNPATVSSGVSYGSGEVSQAFNFNGSNGNLVIPASASLNVGTNSGFTIEGWMKPSDVSGMHMLFEWSDGANLGVHLTHSQSWFGDSGSGPGDLLANIVDSGGGWHPLWSPPGLLTTNSFQHIAMTYDKGSGVGRLYLNGAVIASGNLGSFTPQTSYALNVGKRPWDPNFPLYGGLLDEVSLYSRALSQGELQAIYFAGSAGKCQGAAPFIVSQPQDQNVVAGATATFSVSAGGSPPLNYQWRYNNTDVSGATNSTLNINNAQLSDGGNYAVVVANPFGFVTSAVAVLTVHEAVCTNAPGGLVSWWAGEGNGSDVAGNNPATVSSGVSYGGGEVSQAFNFNGSNGNLVIPASASLNVGTNSGFTIEGWMKPSDVSGMHMLFEWSDGANLGVHLTHSQSWFGDSGSGPGDLLANIVDSGGGWHPLWSPPGLLTTNSFQHIAMTYDKASGVGRLYLNGAVIASGNLGSFTPQTSYNLIVGRRVSDPNFPLYGGLLDEVSLYGRALTQGEVQNIYNAASSGKCHPSGLNLAERPAGTMMIPKAVAGGFQVSFKGIPGREYEIQRALNVNGPWTTLTTVFVAPNGIGFYADTDAPPSKAFYRNVIR